MGKQDVGSGFLTNNPGRVRKLFFVTFAPRTQQELYWEIPGLYKVCKCLCLCF